MPLAQLINTPCTIIRRLASGEVDSYGNEVPTEETAATVCELQKNRVRSSEEPDSQGEFSDTAWSLYLLPGEDIRTGDAISVLGVEYEMVGNPWSARNPRTGEITHMEATVRRTVGSLEGS